MSSSKNSSPVKSKETAAKGKETQLPANRVKTIMKSSPDVENISQDSLFLVTRATELFVQYLAKSAYKLSGAGKSLEYKTLAEIVQTNQNMNFLREIMPRKITVKQYRQLMKKKMEENNSEDESGDGL